MSSVTRKQKVLNENYTHNIIALHRNVSWNHRCLLLYTSLQLTKQSLLISFRNLNLEILKGNWGQSNKFCLKWSFFVMKHNNINKKCHKFLWEPQLAHHVCSVAWMTPLMLRHSLLIQNFGTFLSSWKMANNTIKLYSRFFFHKINKKYAKKTRDEMFLQSRYDVTDVKFKTFSLHNFVKTG